MKRGLVLLLLVVSVFACKPSGLKSNTEAPKGSAAAPVMATDSRVSQVLQKNIWMIEYYISSTDFEGGKKNRGRWYIFKKDGTFESGYWEKKTGSGSWFLREGGKYPIVIIDSYNDAEDSGWEIQGFPEDAYEMSWVGLKEYSNYADLIKMFNMLTPPTKAQFGEK